MNQLSSTESGTQNQIILSSVNNWFYQVDRDVKKNYWFTWKWENMKLPRTTEEESTSWRRARMRRPNTMVFTSINHS